MAPGWQSYRAIAWRRAHRRRWCCPQGEARIPIAGAPAQCRVKAGGAPSGAAREAIYHRFPGRKHQLALEAARRNAEDIRGYLNALPSDSPSWYDIIPLPGEKDRPVALAHPRSVHVTVAK